MVYWTIDKTALAMYIYVFKHYIFAKITCIDFHLSFTVHILYFCYSFY